MIKEELEVLNKMRELKKTNPSEYEEIKNIIKNLHNKKYNKVCSGK